MSSTTDTKPPSTRNRWVIVAVVIIVIALVSAVTINYLTNPKYPASPSILGEATVSTGSPYNLTIDTGTVFSSASVNFGDGSVISVNGTGSQNFTVQHTYSNPGQALIYYTVKAKNGAQYSSGNSLQILNVIPSSTYQSDSQSLGIATINYSESSSPKLLNEPIFGTGSKVTYNIGYYNEPQNSSYQITEQKVTTNFGKSLNVTFNWNSSSGMYEQPSSGLQFNYTFPTEGIYYVKVETITNAVNTTTGSFSSATQKITYSFLDTAIFNNGGLYNANSRAFINVENYIGTPNTLDGAIAYNGQALEVLFNTYQFLVGYVGNTTDQFYPQLADNLPSVSNGEINTNYANYTKSYVNGTGDTVTYAVNLTPFENYTFKIRSNASWQDGTPVTAQDVLYSMVRTLLFDAGSPGTPGWIQAEYLLPGNYYSSNTFYNITQNITVNSAQNSITFHFQHSMAPSLVFQIFAYASGAFVMDSAWMNSHGGNITWNSTGFEDYKVHASVSGYNTYIQNHIMADGPYKLAYVVPGSQVDLIANPSFVSPNPMFPKASITTVIIEYVSDASSRALSLSSGQGSAVSMPTTEWTLVNNLKSAGKIDLYTYPSMDMYFYMFNANVNQTSMNTLTSNANMPSNLFASLNVRKAFSYAFNYNLFFARQVGNEIYNTTFEFPYAGMLIKGLPGYQSVSDLNATTTGVPYFSMTLANQWWSKVDLSKLGISNPGNGYIYNGAKLVVPLMIPAGNPVDQAAFATFSSNLEQLIPGASFPVVTITFSQLLANTGAGSNGMTLWSWLWGPDFPYPTDYMGAMGNPTNLSFFPSANGFVPYYLQSLGYTDQANNLTLMENYYNNGATSTDLPYAIGQFQKQNEMLVNMTMYMYLGQYNFFWIVNKNVNGTDMVKYQTNPVVAGELALMYNLISYNT